MSCFCVKLGLAPAFVSGVKVWGPRHSFGKKSKLGLAPAFVGETLCMLAAHSSRAMSSKPRHICKHCVGKERKREKCFEATCRCFFKSETNDPSYPYFHVMLPVNTQSQKQLIMKLFSIARCRRSSADNTL